MCNQLWVQSRFHAHLKRKGQLHRSAHFYPVWQYSLINEKKLIPYKIFRWTPIKNIFNDIQMQVTNNHQLLIWPSSQNNFSEGQLIHLLECPHKNKYFLNINQLSVKNCIRIISQINLLVLVLHLCSSLCCCLGRIEI